MYCIVAEAQENDKPINKFLQVYLKGKEPNEPIKTCPVH